VRCACLSSLAQAGELHAEELAELQELYSQIFAVDRNATTAALLAAATGGAEHVLQDSVG
jgi:hypothetical protein